LRVALDKASTVAIQLLGNNAHNGAFNSAALARATASSGKVVGLSKATLAGDFAAFTKFVGVDADGNPNGTVNEDARWLLRAPDKLLGRFGDLMKARAQLPYLLNAAGITGFMDALVKQQFLELYDALERHGKLTARATLAQFYDPEEMKTADGKVDYDRMVASAQQVRAKYASDPLIRADVVKLLGDGVMGGNPYSTPPTLPNALSLHPYRQPIFGKDDRGKLTVTGYVDTESPVCQDVRSHQAKYVSSSAVAEFIASHHFHPDQCAISYGQLQHDRAVIMEFVRRFHLAGFTLHVHVIADGTLNAVLDALEAARAADDISTQRDGLAHVQLEQVIPKRRVAARVPGFATAALLAKHTDAIVTLPKPIAMVMARELNLATFETPVKLPHTEVYQYWHERYDRDLGHEWLRALFYDQCTRIAGV